MKKTSVRMLYKRRGRTVQGLLRYPALGVLLFCVNCGSPGELDEENASQVESSLTTPPSLTSPFQWYNNTWGTPVIDSAVGTAHVTPAVIGFLTKAGYPGDANRAALITEALKQLPEGSETGLCDGDAQSYYGASSSEWCSEFVRHVAIGSGVVRDKSYCATSVFGICVHFLYVHDMDSVPSWMHMFNSYGGSISASGIRANTIRPGDYLAMVGSSGHFGHSSLVLGVSSDFTTVYTIEGNVTSPPDSRHCVRFVRRPYFPLARGPVDTNIDALGPMNELF